MTKQFEVKEIAELSDLNNQTIRFDVPNLDQAYDYQNCLSTKYFSFSYCDKTIKENILRLPKLSNDEYYYIGGRKGFIYFNNEYAFVHGKMSQNIYEDGYLQFGFPKSISISDDGLSRLVTYNKPRKDLDDVCYHEILNKSYDRYEFKQDCDKVKKTLKFHSMQRVKIPKTIYIFIHEKSPRSFEPLIKQRMVSVNGKYNFLIELSTITGERTEKPNILLYLLYPPAFIFDIITFPIQIFVVPFGKNALG
ncbi:hypothetical protein [Leptospira tipperaryensis]|uniref:hypothetical protein n=1 Tax=Leptospira tipperaryensis TaxID=2564040 RepID=UPI0012EA3114|nr:hypothetical protein [Leptospira tipperaryensis]